MCVLRQSELRFAYLSRLHRNHYRWQGRGATEREEKFSLSVSCFIITLCRMERRFITIPVFGGFDKDERRDDEKEKSLGILKVLVSLRGRTLGGHGYE